ncbi:hypothetical protein GETHLI_35730 [Geothrix limicola]|uniref:Uncharacterized protein n=1 Tax=Geothrix limicola TaxID=2927978 RepID=A0ABQ5QJM0_9BACT|nr:hypothetical protein [Geothrix limicola]GLH75070.1 hypothetical protein GETHLI_35730 [Geothrix limicola]
MGPSSDRALRLAAKILAATAGKVTDSALVATLAGTALSPFSVIAGPALGVAVKVLIEQLTDETSKLEAKLDLILREPLLSACQTLQEVLSAQFRTAAEIQERERQLAVAFDNLKRAYNYTEEKNTDNQLVIRMYQAIVAALKEGGRPFAYLYVGDLYAVASEARGEAALLRDTATAIDPQFFEEHRGDVVRYAVDWDHYYQLQASVNKTIENEEQHKEELLTKAANLEKAASYMESLCSLVRKVAENRKELFATD